MCTQCGIVMPGHLLPGHLAVHRRNKYRSGLANYVTPSYDPNFPPRATGNYHVVAPPAQYLLPSQRYVAKRSRVLKRRGSVESLNQKRSKFESTEQVPEESSMPQSTDKPVKKFCEFHPSINQCFRNDCSTLRHYICDICNSVLREGD